MVDILDKVKSGFDKGFTAVSVKSKEVIEVTKIRNQIGGLQEQITQLQNELGEFVFKLYLQGNLDTSKIHEKCEFIAGLETQIREKEAELKDVRMKAAEAMGRNFCDGCEAELSDGAKFCSECGKKTDGA